MKNRWEIILAGYGGQGLNLAGQLLAAAAITYSDLNVTHSQSYGAQARGGASQSSLIISSDEIIYPLVEQVDIFAALSPGGYAAYEPLVSPGEGIVLYDSSVSTIKPKGRVKEQGFPFHKETEKLGYPQGITLMALGTALEMFKFIPPQAFMDSLEKHFSGKTLEMNSKAFQHGRNLLKNTG